MKKWNRTGKVKALLLGLLGFHIIVNPIAVQPDISLLIVFSPLLTGALWIVVFTRINATIFGQIIERPHWNDNPLNLKRPMRLYQFMAMFFLTGGVGIMTGSLIEFQYISLFGLATSSFGIGISLGIAIMLRMTENRYP